MGIQAGTTQVAPSYAHVSMLSEVRPYGIQGPVEEALQFGTGDQSQACPGKGLKRLQALQEAVASLEEETMRWRDITQASCHLSQFHFRTDEAMTRNERWVLEIHVFQQQG